MILFINNIEKNILLTALNGYEFNVFKDFLRAGEEKNPSIMVIQQHHKNVEDLIEKIKGKEKNVCNKKG